MPTHQFHQLQTQSRPCHCQDHMLHHNYFTPGNSRKNKVSPLETAQIYDILLGNYKA